MSKCEEISKAIDEMPMYDHLKVMLHAIKTFQARYMAKEEGAREEPNAQPSPGFDSPDVDLLQSAVSGIMNEALSYEMMRRTLAGEIARPAAPAEPLRALPDPPPDAPTNPFPGYAPLLGGIFLPTIRGDPEYDRLLGELLKRVFKPS